MRLGLFSPRIYFSNWVFFNSLSMKFCNSLCRSLTHTLLDSFLSILFIDTVEKGNVLLDPLGFLAGSEN